MGFSDYLSDLYASLTVQPAEAETANPGPEDTSGEQSRGSDVRAGGMSTAHHGRGATTRGGVSTKSPVAGTNEESEGEKQENEKTAQSTRARTIGSGDSSSSGDDTSANAGDDASADDEKEDGGDEGAGEGGDEEGGDDEEEEEEEEDEEEEEEPEDLMPKLQEDCMKTAQCAPLKHHYDECAERVQHQESQHGKAHEDCVEEFFHLMHCASQCAAPKLFRQLR